MGSKTINQITETQTVILDTDSIELQEAAGTSKKTTFAYIKTWILTWIYRYIYPVGSFYVQYPDAASNDDAIAFPVSARPVTMFGGTWVEQFNTDSVFFKTGNVDGQARVNGLSADQIASHVHEILTDSNNQVMVAPGGSVTGFGVTNTSAGYSASVSAKGIISGNSGTKTEPRNRLMKLWKRTVL